MEHPAALRAGGGTYRWHAGAPDDDVVRTCTASCRAHSRTRSRIYARVPRRDEGVRSALEGEPESGAATRAKVTDEYVAAAYGEELLELARRTSMVVLDADLASDCRIRPFELAYPDRFHEAGIAEQDMVSAAAGMAAKVYCRREFLRDVPCLPRERADLQPGERTHEGRLRAPLRRTDSRRPREVAPERTRCLAARGPAEHEHRAAGKRRGDQGASALGRRGCATRTWRSGSRSVRRRDGSSSAMSSSLPAAAVCAGRQRTRCSSPTGP